MSLQFAICKHGDAVYSSWQLYPYRRGRKEVFVNLLVRKIIYDYMYPVDLENNERSCEYSAIVVPTFKDIVTQPHK
jgi:hypothetical protein